MSAIPLWQRAGELGLARMALTDSISHLSKGLELIVALPASPGRDASVIPKLDRRNCLSGARFLAARFDFSALRRTRGLLTEQVPWLQAIVFNGVLDTRNDPIDFLGLQ